ncbi:hypothetical protein [Blastococcus sp. LR1]|uniref:hypothetical protein n=1 Tax=Blastococcus sp. LR1 TaxID=2877000 RepID=UPI001CCBC7CA|nr:hypothetical protein [Blastococcus sp. LR1]MCA0144685.1 hypothetical protein [Blastococcus sp. LR1]
MARLEVVGDQLRLRLNALEKLLDLRLHSPSAPVAAIRGVTVDAHPRETLHDVDLGFAGNTALLGAVVTASSRAAVPRGRAATFVYLGREAVRIELDDEHGGWRLFLVSCKNAEDVAAAIRSATGRIA